MYNKALSYSSVSLFKKCPAQWEWKYILGHWDAPGKSAQRGTDLHDILETFYKHPHTTLPAKQSEFRPWKSFLEQLREYGPVPEGEVAVKSNWSPCDYKDPEAYYRGKVDLKLPAGDHLFILDWKTGNMYDDHWMQGAHYSALSPGHDKYTVLFAYLDHPTVIHRWEYNGEDVEALRAEATELIEEVRTATHYPFNKGPHCRWCPRSRSKGGDCKFA